MITRIAHVCLSARDLAAAEKFYCGVLGLKKQFDFMNQEKRLGFYLQVGAGTYIEIFANQAAPAEAGPIRHLCLETDDIDAQIAQVKARGWPIGEKEMGRDHSWQVWLKAPDGVDIEFHQYTPESCQRTGKTCEVDW